jgi:hypothetical protein
MGAVAKKYITKVGCESFVLCRVTLLNTAGDALILINFINISHTFEHLKLSATLHLQSGPKKLGANFEHFWLVVWPPSY